MLQASYAWKKNIPIPLSGLKWGDGQIFLPYVRVRFFVLSQHNESFFCVLTTQWVAGGKSWHHAVAFLSCHNTTSSSVQEETAHMSYMMFPSHIKFLSAGGKKIADASYSKSICSFQKADSSKPADTFWFCVRIFCSDDTMNSSLLELTVQNQLAAIDSVFCFFCSTLPIPLCWSWHFLWLDLTSIDSVFWFLFHTTNSSLLQLTLSVTWHLRCQSFFCFVFSFRDTTS